MDDQNNITPTTRDVLNGRGQGVQRHPGNVKYRKLVFVNKELYAKCPRSDKIKISKGIVAAIRKSGGRFLEHNERQDYYFDIGDKKATEKTSQALREGQKDIRKNLYKSEEGGLANSTNSAETNQASNVTMPAEPEMLGKQLPPEDYSQYSLLVLEALYNSDGDLPAPPSMVAAPAPPPVPQPVKQQSPPPPPPPPLPAVQNNMMYGVPSHAFMGHPSNAAMAMALDQFPGAIMAPMHPMSHQIQHPMQQQFDPRAHFAMGGELSHPSFRLTDMSLGSAFSIRELLESVRNTGYQPMGLRGTLDSMLSAGTLEMIRQSQLQLNQIDQMDIDDLNPSQIEIDALFDRNSLGSRGSGDRVSDLRFSDLSKDRFTDFQNARNTDCSETSKNTSYSGSSSGREVSSQDSESAQLLLGLANQSRNDGYKSNKMEE
ncbi:hypothetical protein ACHAWO_006998 [Cyclotella atomus]|uniref:DUF6824 domain-containing protein n=1 Tax=Cyclotella atomus TaxID=382360 RepID=A0ABD3NTQ8_9STRA